MYLPASDDLGRDQGKSRHAGVGHRVEHGRPGGPDQMVGQRSTGEPVGKPAKRHRGRQRVQTYVFVERVSVVGDVGTAGGIGVGQLVDIVHVDEVVVHG